MSEDASRATTPIPYAVRRASLDRLERVSRITAFACLAIAILGAFGIPVWAYFNRPDSVLTVAIVLPLCGAAGIGAYYAEQIQLAAVRARRVAHEEDTGGCAAWHAERGTDCQWCLETPEEDPRIRRVLAWVDRRIARRSNEDVGAGAAGGATAS